MGKAHRGKNLKMEVSGAGRGPCPVCKRSGVKVLYEHEINGKKIKTCKHCRAAIAHGKMKDALAAVS